MTMQTRTGTRRCSGLVLTMVVGLGLMAPALTASAQHYHHKHRVVRYVRVHRHGHWTTVRRVSWR